MGQPILSGPDIPTKLPSTKNEAVVQADLAVDGSTWQVTCVSMGNPHCVTFGTKELKVIDLQVHILVVLNYILSKPLICQNISYTNMLNCCLLIHVDLAIIHLWGYHGLLKHFNIFYVSIQECLLRPKVYSLELQINLTCFNPIIFCLVFS